MKKGIRLTSSFTGQHLHLDIEEVVGVEGTEDSKDAGKAKSKVYTRTKGNFYVLEPDAKISELVFQSSFFVEGF